MYNFNISRGETMDKNKQMTINLVSGIVLLIVNVIISFFLYPHIIETLGEEAYGFVSLANNFVNYASVVTIALNSMASRFLTIAVHKGNEKEANQYFNSIFISNIFIVILLFIPATICIFNLEKILNISNYLVGDVKVLFSLIFLNFFIGLLSTAFSIATYCTNKLYLSSLRNIESGILKIGLLGVLFAVFQPSIKYLGIATLISTIYLFIFNIRYTIKLLPNIQISKKFFSLRKTKELIFSGIWNTITKLGQLLSDGLDLIICNIMISSSAMGQLAIAKTISSIMGSLLSTVTSVFQPQLTIYYAKEQIGELVFELKKSMKISGFFSNVSMGFLVVFSTFFFQLWVPSQNAEVLSILTILTIQGVIVSGAINPLYSVYTITNKIKFDAILRIIVGFVCVGVLFILLKTTNLEIYAVAGVSTTIGLIVNFISVPLYAAHCLKIKWYTFYPVLFRYMITTAVIIGCYFLIKPYFISSSWVYFVISSFVVALLGVAINYFVLLNKNERKELNKYILNLKWLKRKVED